MDLPAHVLHKGLMFLVTASGKTLVKASANPWEGIRAQKPLCPRCEGGCASGCVRTSRALDKLDLLQVGEQGRCVFPGVRIQEDLAMEGTRVLTTVRGAIGSGTIGSGGL